MHYIITLCISYTNITCVPICYMKYEVYPQVKNNDIGGLLIDLTD